MFLTGILTYARHFVDERDALGFEFRERFVDILDFEADVIQAALAVGNHARVLALWCGARNQLDHRLADGVEREFYLACGQMFNAAHGMPKQSFHNRLPTSTSRTTTPICSIRLIFMRILFREMGNERLSLVCYVVSASRAAAGATPWRFHRPSRCAECALRRNRVPRSAVTPAGRPR